MSAYTQFDEEKTIDPTIKKQRLLQAFIVKYTPINDTKQANLLLVIISIIIIIAALVNLGILSKEDYSDPKYDIGDTAEAYY